MISSCPTESSQRGIYLRPVLKFPPSSLIFWDFLFLVSFRPNRVSLISFQKPNEAREHPTFLSPTFPTLRLHSLPYLLRFALDSPQTRSTLIPASCLRSSCDLLLHPALSAPQNSHLFNHHVLLRKLPPRLPRSCQPSGCQVLRLRRKYLPPLFANSRECSRFFKLHASCAEPTRAFAQSLGARRNTRYQEKPNTNQTSPQTLNLRRPASASPFAQPRDYKRVLPSERLSDSAFKVSDLEL